MNAIYQPLNNQNIYPSGELTARRVLLIEQASKEKRAVTSLDHFSDSDRLQTVSVQLEVLSKEQNFTSFDVSPRTDGLLNQVNKAQANMLVLIVDQLTSSLIAQLSNINQLAPLIVVVFARKHCSESAQNLSFAGIDSYKVGCSGPAFHTTDLAVILDVAENHFAHLVTLKSELQQTQKKLDDRKIIERAKGILMQQHRLSEEKAYAQMRRSAMNQGRPMADLARCLINIVESTA